MDRQPLADVEKPLSQEEHSRLQQFRRVGKKVTVYLFTFAVVGVFFVATFGYKDDKVAGTSVSEPRRMLDDSDIQLIGGSDLFDDDDPEFGDEENDEDYSEDEVEEYSDDDDDDDDEEDEYSETEDDDDDDDEDDSGRNLRRRRRRRKPKKQVTPLDIPDDGCGTMRSTLACINFSNCVWSRNKCKTSKKRSYERVLFVGNSYTIRNKMTQMFQSLARKKKKSVEAYMLAAGSMTFGSHARNSLTMSVIPGASWKAVVLQEQSMFLSTPRWQYLQNSIPHAKTLYGAARESAETVVLYQTWGYRYGNPSYITGLDDDYYKMQDRIKAGYEYTAETLEGLRENATDAKVAIAYVGEAWREVYADYVDKLYDYDASHPQPLGSYLAACVMYARIYGESPEGIRWKHRKISWADARKMQQVAAQVVLG